MTGACHDAINERFEVILIDIDDITLGTRLEPFLDFCAQAFQFHGLDIIEFLLGQDHRDSTSVTLDCHGFPARGID
jgi:hypothetical protein